MRIETNWIGGKKLLEIIIEGGGYTVEELITSKQEAEWLISNLESVIDDLKKSITDWSKAND